MFIGLGFVFLAMYMVGMDAVGTTTTQPSAEKVPASQSSGHSDSPAKPAADVSAWYACSRVGLNAQYVATHDIKKLTPAQ